MNGNVILNDKRWLAATLLVLAIGVFLEAHALANTRREARNVANNVEAAETSIARLEVELEERQLHEGVDGGPHGPGPGGIRTTWDPFLFEGPTAARSALDLVLTSYDVGFDRLSYTSDNIRELGVYPSDSEGSEGSEGEMSESKPLPVKNRYRLIEWPVVLSVDSDYESLVRIIDRLTESRPAFAVSEWNLSVILDDRGNVQDRLTLVARLSTFWLIEEKRS